MNTSEVCKLRYCRANGTDWHVERISRAAAAFRKKVLQDMGWIVVVDGGPAGHSAFMTPEPTRH